MNPLNLRDLVQDVPLSHKSDQLVNLSVTQFVTTEVDPKLLEFLGAPQQLHTKHIFVIFSVYNIVAIIGVP